MTFKIFLLIPLVFGLCVSGHAQEKKAPAVQVRAVLHDPVNPSANLFYSNEGGEVVQLEFRSKDLSRPMLMSPVNGSLVLFDTATIDPENPAASMAASAKLPTNVRKVIAVVMPGPEGQEPAYRMLLIDDSQKAFPQGESRVVPLIGVNTAIQAGEHRLPVKPGEITRVPPVKKVNEFNMAQTNFYYERGDAWMAFTERQLQYLDACRRLFIVHATPGATAPTVTTIVDTARPGLPR